MKKKTLETHKWKSIKK